MKFENRVEIAKPAGVVFSYLADLGNLPAWNYAIKETVKQSPGPVAVGTLYQQTRTLPHPMTEELRVTALEPDSLLRITGGFGQFTGSSTYELTALSPSRTLVTNSMDLETRGFLAALASLATASIKSAVGENLVVLKGILER
ncbi:SRPBCC family protein [Streptomyces sp. NBC_01190]|uniref:SRPBCC family protein n=1 Tax=Streptomyces sp. NBC_01190 TaxID=2903767 RepID=UPI0038643F7E|nr:SRPBCC family protein [Streptomyces sp. NBC_01190]